VTEAKKILKKPPIPALIPLFPGAKPARFESLVRGAGAIVGLFYYLIDFTYEIK